MALTKNEERLADLLQQFPHPNHEGDDYESCLICISAVGRERGWTDEFIRICEENSNATFDEILDLIFTNDRFPPLEIVDDEELEED